MDNNEPGHKVRCSIRLEFASGAEARKILKAVELDNQGYLNAGIDGATILADIEAESLNSLLHTIDDFLSCTSVAEKVISGKP